MKWIYDGLGGGHNGEYYWACSECGREEWWPSYENPNKLGIQCGKCEETKAKNETKLIELRYELELRERDELRRLTNKYGELK